jgi:Rad3-related DNA helicase
VEESTVVAPTVKNLISEKSADLRDHFPFNTIRENQNETLDKLAIWNKSNKKFFILEAATGFGKSPINIAEASWAKTSKGQFKPGAYILTPQKTLAQQYMTDFEPLGLVELKGRTNYTCASWSKQMGDRVNCEDGASMNEAQRKKISDQDKNPSEEPDNFVDQNPSPEEPDDFVDQNPSPEVRCGSCPYRIAKDKFMHYPFGTTNFAYYLYESNLSGQLPRRNNYSKRLY